MLLLKLVFLLTSLIRRYPVWTILYIARPLKLFGYLFLVYPGEEKTLMDIAQGG